MAAAQQAQAQALRLRPVVHASRVAGGLHVRGWASSFTVEGGPGLWRLWQALAAALAEGASPERLAALSGRDSVRAAVTTLLGQLREHDMLVDAPAGWGAGTGPAEPVARWLEAVAPDPAAAWARIRAARVDVTGGGRLAAAVARALTATGASAHVHDDGDRGRVVLTDGHGTVVAGADGDAGFAGPVAPGPPGPAVADTAAAVAARLGLAAVAGADAETPVLAAFVGGVAAHRLLCALAGLPDPGADGFSPVPAPAAALGRPTVFVARLDPLRGTYHPWLGDLATGTRPAGDRTAPPGSPDGAPGGGPAGDGRLDRALALADALTDPETGPLPPVRLGDLPQVPAGLAAVAAPGRTAVGVAATVDVARLLAVLGAAERAVRTTVAARPGVLAVGADRRHADGVALRRLAHLTVSSGAAVPGELLDEASWAGSPVARQWWKALTLRLGVAAHVTVTRLGDGVHHAAVTAHGAPLGWAVEAAPADAAAFALLAAVGTAQWCAADPAAAAGSWTPHPPCGATPAPPVADRARVPWESGAWAWPAPLAGAEPALQDRLRQLLGAAPRLLTRADGLRGAVAGACVVVRVPR